MPKDPFHGIAPPLGKAPEPSAPPCKAPAKTKAHRLPLGQQFGGALLYFVQQCCVQIALPQCGALAALGQVMGYGMVGQGAQAVGVALG